MLQSITKSQAPSKWNFPRLVFWAILISAGMILAFILDRPLLWLFHRIPLDSLPGDVIRTLESFKEFGQVLAIVVGFLLIFALDKPRRKILPLLLVTILLPLGPVYPSKLCIHRLRPPNIDYYQTTWGLGFFTGQQPPPSTLTISLQGEEKITVDKPLRSSAKQSFPSAHTAAAFAFAAGLSALYPAGRIIFYVLAGGCGLHRVLFDAHWPSDVLAGALLGLLIARALARSFRLNRLI